MTRARIQHPPLAPLHALLERLERNGLAFALGGSGLLAAYGLVTHVRDWDVTVEAPIHTLEEACAGLDFVRFGSDGCHADHKLTFERDSVELIAGFAFAVPGGVVRIPTVITGRWNEVPLGSPTAWAAAYALMGELEDSEKRRERAGMLFGWLESRPLEREVIATLRSQPLTTALRDALTALERAADPNQA